MILPWIAQTIGPTPIYNSISEVNNDIVSQQTNFMPKLTLMKNEVVYVLLKQYSKNNWLCPNSDNKCDSHGLA